MQSIVPKDWLFRPFPDGVAKQSLDLRAYVDFAQSFFFKGRHKRHRRELLEEDLVAGFRFEETRLGRRAERFGVRLTNEAWQLEAWQECARQTEQRADGIKVGRNLWRESLAIVTLVAHHPALSFAMG